MRPGAEGETAAASDPEDCEEAKYGWLPEQMKSLWGNRFKASWNSQRIEVKEGTNNVRPPGEPFAAAGRANKASPMLPGGPLPSWLVITPLMRLSMNTKARASGLSLSRI